MADVVEQILEKSLTSLQDLVARRLLSSTEAKSLVETRRQFEYKLQRRAARRDQRARDWHPYPLEPGRRGL